MMKTIRRYCLLLLALLCACENPLTETIAETETGIASDITINSVVLSGVSRFGPSMGDVSIGMVLSTEPVFDIESGIVAKAMHIDVTCTMTVVVDGLSSGTTYNYKSFLTVGGKTYYGNVKSFTTQVSPVTGVSLDQESLVMTEGDPAVRLTASVEPKSATNKSVVWSSSDDAVASVNQNGEVQALLAGEADITATTVDGNHTASCHVIVNKKIILVTQIRFERPNYELPVGSRMKLTPIVEPENASDPTVTWESADAGVVDVDEGGEVVAVSIGSGPVAITARTVDGSGVFGTCYVSVTPIGVESVTVDPKELKLHVSETYNLKAIVLPDNATNKDVTWASHPDNVATVSKTGEVKALGNGEATITVTTKDGGKEDQCSVLVTTPIQSVSIDREELSMIVGRKQSITVTINPSTASVSEIKWSSDNSALAAVDGADGRTCEIKAVGVGDTDILVTVKDHDGGEFQAKSHVTIKKETIHVTGISLEATSITMEEGESRTLAYTIEPADADNHLVSWRTSDESVVSVSDKGVLLALSADGSPATISVITDDGGKRADCVVTVKKKIIPVSSVSVTPKEVEMHKVDDSVQLTASVSPDNASNKDVVWSTSDEKVASVNDSGLVEAVGNGTATITVTTVDGNYKDECSVSVSISVTDVKISPNSLTLMVGETHALTAIVEPEMAFDKSVSWESSYPAIAAVDHNGVVEAKEEGSATITVKTRDGGKRADCSVLVKKKVVPVASVSISPENLNMYVGDSEQLTCEVLPKDADDKTVTWSSSDSSVASVSETGVVVAKSEGNATITVTTHDGNYSASCQVAVTEAQTVTGLEAVDLGLPSGTKWANMNLGATKPEEYGDYYAWGETAPKARYNWDTYKWWNGWGAAHNTMSKYNFDPDYGVVDYKVSLDALDDAAHVVLGGNWKTPSYSDWQELLKYSSRKLDYLNGVFGLLITSKVAGYTNKSIFLPAAGSKSSSGDSAGSSGCYWMSTCDCFVMCYAFAYLFDKSGFNFSISNGRFRCLGCPVRAVSGGSNIVSVESVVIEPSELTINKGQTASLSISYAPDNALFKTALWSVSDESVISVCKQGGGSKVTAVNAGTAQVIATTPEGKKAYCTINVITDNQFEAVDLGLPSGIKWANMNLGASSVDDYGAYYAWGEHNIKTNYDWSNYLWGNSQNELVKYCNKSNYGKVDSLRILEDVDDAACSSLGDKWRIPTYDDLMELSDPSNCTWSWSEENSGYLVISVRNSNSIFLPSAGEYRNSLLFGAKTNGYYWLSSIDSEYPYKASFLSFYSTLYKVDSENRCSGLSIRPVYGNKPTNDNRFVSSVGLDKNELYLIPGHTATLLARVMPESAKNKNVIWTTSDSSIAKVEEGRVFAFKPGEVLITVTTIDGEYSAQCKVIVSPIPAPDESEAVDLGLSVKWAPYNVGATSPEEYGCFYAWGETEIKEEYSWSTYKWCNQSVNTITKYNSDSSCGAVDNKTSLDSDDDIAHVVWGGKWRMPSYSEIKDLSFLCKWTKTSLNGIEGYLIESKTEGNDGFIFIPIAGTYEEKTRYSSRGHYWGVTKHYDSGKAACIICFDTSSVIGQSYYTRCYGLPVRPVCD